MKIDIFNNSISKNGRILLNIQVVPVLAVAASTTLCWIQYDSKWIAWNEHDPTPLSYIWYYRASDSCVWRLNNNIKIIKKRTNKILFNFITGGRSFSYFLVYLKQIQEMFKTLSCPRSSIRSYWQWRLPQRVWAATYKWINDFQR